MSKFELYSLILCIIVFILLVSLFSYLLTIIIKLSLKHIRAGLEDNEILKKFNTSKKQGKAFKVVNMATNILFCLFFGVIFLSSVYINCTQNVYFDNTPTFRVVLTSSMESKNEKNKYLFDNDINNQISSFDLIATYKIPKEEDLNLYDIVVYEIDGILVVHRIVGIEEPNERHPNERHFLLQGDAVGSPDRFPVRYSKMKGIYKGERIPFVGSLVLFMQSPAGWLCILLVVVAIVGTPILEKKLLKARKMRFALIGQNQEIATTENVDADIKHSNLRFLNFKPTKTFYEKLDTSTEQIKNRYDVIKQTLYNIVGIRVIKGKTRHSYKCKNHCIAKLLFKGKTLIICLGLNPNNYKDKKYIFTDLSNKTKFKNYPMCLKLTSDRQARWANELIIELVKSKGLVILEKSAHDINNGSSFESLKGKVVRKSFKQKLRLSPLAKERFKNLKDFMKTIDNIRVIEGKYAITYKIKSKPIVKFIIKGKTLNAYLGLTPNDYKKTKYIFTDVSNVIKYANYPMRVKVSSDRQVKWVKELIQEVIKK